MSVYVRFASFEARIAEGKANETFCILLMLQRDSALVRFRDAIMLPLTSSVFFIYSTHFMHTNSEIHIANTQHWNRIGEFFR